MNLQCPNTCTQSIMYSADTAKIKFTVCLALLRKAGDRHSGTHLRMVLCPKSLNFWNKRVPEEPVPLRAGSRATCKALNRYNLPDHSQVRPP